MRTKYSFSLLSTILLLPAIVFAQPGFTLKGRVNNLKKPAKVYLTYQFNDKEITDSAGFKNGFFELHFKTDYPVTAKLIIARGGKPSIKARHYDELSSYLEPTAIHYDELSIYLEPKAMQLTAADSIKNAKVLNSKINTEYDVLKSRIQPLDAGYARLNSLLSKLSPEQAKTDTSRKEVIKKVEQNRAQLKELKEQFIHDYPKSIISFGVIRDFTAPFIDTAKSRALLAILDESVKETAPAKKYIEYLNVLSRLAIGAIAPAFSQPDTTGKLVSLASFRGKYVLLDFWASWCGPCRAENPNVVKNYAQYHDKGLEILGISLDNAQGKQAWLQAIHKDNLTWTQVSDLKFFNNEAALLYSVRGIPQNFLIGPDGRIVAKSLHGEELGKKLAELLK